MSAWPGKYVIGLTGNIATGKSVVRKMLEHLGAYGIDADALGHRVMAKGAPGYAGVLEMFGRWVLDEDGNINRSKLAMVVFNDPAALGRLEAIVHPYVQQAIDILVRRSKHSVVVIEAIKLIESGLTESCDTLWVTYAPQELQLARLMGKRNMSDTTARMRIESQPPQEAKIGQANVVIRNDGSFEDTWLQVNDAWGKVFPTPGKPESDLGVTETFAKNVVVQRARPRDAEDIARLITKLSKGERFINRDEVMAAFGEKAFLLLQVDGKAMGVIGWKVENLIARTDDVYLDGSVAFRDAMQALMLVVERASKELQCEISLLFLPTELRRFELELKEIGYEQRTIQSLGVSAWEEAAAESMPADAIMLFKQLRQDRVLRPV
jgi:dephospho-CoA kinase